MFYWLQAQSRAEQAEMTDRRQRLDVKVFDLFLRDWQTGKGHKLPISTAVLRGKHSGSSHWAQNYQEQQGVEVNASATAGGLEEQVL